MNEEAFNDSFNLFASQGYNGSLEDYKELMIDNNDAFKDSYNLFKSEGYNGSENEFAELISIGSNCFTYSSCSSLVTTSCGK